MGARIGVDLGGTKIEGIVLDDDAAVRHRIRRDTPRGDYEATVAAAAGVVRRLQELAGARPTVGVGAPGAPSGDAGLMKNSNCACLNGRPLQADLEAALGREVRLANDADCFALAEARSGAGRGARTVFGAILGTGVGGGIVTGGRLLTGPNRIAGEWGHNPAPPAALDPVRGGRDCHCGRRDCVETLLCGRGMVRTFEELGGTAEDPREIARRAEGGDALARRCLDVYGRQLAGCLAVVVNLIDPEVVVLGGGLSNIAGLYRAALRRLAEHVFSDAVATRLVPPAFGDAAGARGAAWLWE